MSETNKAWMVVCITIIVLLFAGVMLWMFRPTQAPSVYTPPTTYSCEPHCVTVTQTK